MRTNKDVEKVELSRQKIDSSEEWQNFTGLIDDARRLFNPNVATLRSQVAKGAVIKDRRISDLGISFRKDYTAGIMSEMITSGEQWFNLDADDLKQEEFKELKRQSGIMRDRMNAVNFVAETYKAVSSSCADGTVCEYVEQGMGDELRYCTVPFGSFWFKTNFYWKPDRVWIEKKISAGALVEKYGEEKVSEKCLSKFKENPEEEVSIIYYCAPRKKRDSEKRDVKNKAYEVLIYEKGESDPNLLEEGGADSQMFHVYRVGITGIERLGRGPCIDAMSTMNEIEQVLSDMRRSRRLKVVPTLALPASQGLNSYKWIHESACSYLVYNDSGLSGQPPQEIISPADINEGEEWIEWLTKLMRGLFFLDYFNPLQDRRNMTLGETRERVQKSQQMVDQITGPLEKELLTPILKRTYQLLGESGAFDTDEMTWADIQDVFAGRMRIRYSSRLANAQRMVQLSSDLEAAQQMMFVGQAIPEPFLLEFAAQIDWSKYPKRIVEGTNATKSLLRDEEDAQDIINAFRQAQAQAQQMESLSQEADAFSKASKAPEQGSPAAQLIEAQI